MYNINIILCNIMWRKVLCIVFIAEMLEEFS